MADRSPGARRVHQVSSSGNALVKLFRRALAEGTTREGWLAVEGPLLLEEAIKAASEHEAAGPVVQSVLASNAAIRKFAALIDRLPSEAEVTEVPDRVFTEIAQTETPQGIAALVELPAYDLDAILARRDALLVIACGVQDPGNLGTIMRSLQALGGSALVTLRATVSPYNPKVVRSSAGGIFCLPVFRGLEAGWLAARLRATGVAIAAADRHARQSLATVDLRGPVAFLIGREAAGVPAELAREADLRLSIPIRAGMDSLNAATAAGILLYEAARQRGFHY
ncbi:MAG TPA: RNA methyltransferase [Terriglobia bacterium]|nr:RNA methyltransferase [Terriglobia bacterium]